MGVYFDIFTAVGGPVIFGSSFSYCSGKAPVKLFITSLTILVDFVLKRSILDNNLDNNGHQPYKIHLKGSGRDLFLSILSCIWTLAPYKHYIYTTKHNIELNP